MKNLFLLFTFFCFLSCEPVVDFSAGTENRVTGIMDFGSWTADYNSDDFMNGDCSDSEICEVSTFDDGNEGNERYYIDISSTDYYNMPNDCSSDWDGMQHSLRIITTRDQIDDQFVVTSGYSGFIGSQENPIISIVYNIKRYSESEGDINREYFGYLGTLDVVDFNKLVDFNDENLTEDIDGYVSGSFFGTVYRHDDMGELDSVVIKNIVFNNINVDWLGSVD